MTEDPEGFGERLARLRSARGWSQRQLGERTGLGGTQISKYERQEYQPRPEALGRLAAALGTSIDYLLTGRERKPVRDSRLRNLLPILEDLPEVQRDNLVYFLEALVKAQALLALHERKKTAR